MTAMLWIAAKAPRPGFAKTRLAASIGDAATVALYRAFLSDVADRFATAPFRHGWYVTPPDSFSELAAIVGPDATLLAQPDGSWGARQRHLFRGAAARGEDCTIIIASDSPQLTVEAVAAAFAALEASDIVIGPVHDGGYHLLGIRGPHDVLRGIRMSTESVVEEIEARARTLGLSVAFVAGTFDIDEADDLALLRPVARARPDLAATHAALEAIA